MLNAFLISLIKALHTAVFFVVAGCIVYALRSGLSGRGSRPLLLGCLLFPTLIGALWLLNGKECILSTAIYALAGGDRSTPDIYLPVWLAEWIMTGSTLLLVVAAALVLGRALSRTIRRQ
jgi:hypothetical protein